MNFINRKEKLAYSLARRLLARAKRSSGVIPKRMDISFVSIGKRRYKRIKFIDNFTSESTNCILEKLTDYKYFPKVLIQYENELWVEYVEGDQLKKIDPTICNEFANLYSILYKKSSKEVCADKFIQHINTNLEFLSTINFIDNNQQQKLLVLLEKIAPEKVWVGLDYSDAILSNFLIEKETNTVFAIDVDSFKDEALIGTGLAKAQTVWMHDNDLNHIINLMKENSSPNFYRDMLFIKLHFRSEWLKGLYLRNKLKRLRKNINILSDLL